MPRPSTDGAAVNASILTRSKWTMLRAFLLLEAIKGNPHALKLLGELPRNSGKVKA